jgi:hypothetical protein
MTEGETESILDGFLTVRVFSYFSQSNLAAASPEQAL